MLYVSGHVVLSCEGAGCFLRGEGLLIVITVWALFKGEPATLMKGLTHESTKLYTCQEMFWANPPNLKSDHLMLVVSNDSTTTYM